VALVAASAAILIWSSLATLGVSLTAVPPLLLIGSSLLIGGALSIPWARRWNLRLTTVGVGCYGMLLYHLLFMLALRNAPPVTANLVHYSWPMLIVLLAPVALPGFRLRALHVLCAIVGFSGAALAIAGDRAGGSAHWHWGYAFAAAAAVVWSTYSLALKRMAASTTADVGLACIVSGVIALGLHALIEPTLNLQAATYLRIVLLGAGPMGAAFYLWAYALKRGDPRVIGVLANATPLLSTGLLVASGHGTVSTVLVVATALVSAASVLVLLAPPAAGRTRVLDPQEVACL
jgi:drug/metabolite transporter (DMT)-like permease